MRRFFLFNIGTQPKSETQFFLNKKFWSFGVTHKKGWGHCQIPPGIKVLPLPDPTYSSKREESVSISTIAIV